MKKENSKLIIIILILLTISLSATYAFLNLSASGASDANQGGCLQVNYTGQAINNSSLQSTTDYTQGATSDITLSKNANCDIYSEASIYIHTDAAQTDAPLSNGALKYKVMQGTTEINSGSIAAVDEQSEDQLLATVTLTSTSTTYTVYLWIDPEISQGTYNEKTYTGYLYASSTQSSTVTGA